jgi:sec-independent protein translocase protein TatA
MGIGNPVHLIFLAAIALVVLGPKRLPEMARSLGDGMRQFRESMENAGEDHSTSAPPAPAPVAAAPVLNQPQLVATSVPVTTPVPVDPAEPVPSGDAPDRRPL